MNTNFDPIDKIRFWYHNLEPYIKSIDGIHASSLLSMGPYTSEFESLIASMLGANHCVCLSSGTAGLLASLLALDISSDATICIPNRTFIGTANAASMRGNEIVLIDSCENNQNTSPESLKEAFLKLSGLNKTIVYVYVPVNGSFWRYDEILQICRSFNVLVIIDACQTFGSNPSASKQILDMGFPLVYSFGLTKLISIGLGGCIVTNCTQFYDRLISIRNQGLNFGNHSSSYIPSLPIGFNFKITDFHSLIGIPQLLNFTTIRESHISTFQHYHNRLNGVLNISSVVEHSQLEFPLRFEAQVHSREHLHNFLLDNNIETQLNTNNISDNANFDHVNLVDLHNSSKFANNIIVFPSGPSQEFAKIDYVCDKILEYSKIFEM